MEHAISELQLNYYKNKAELLSMPYSEQISQMPYFIRENAADDIANEWMDCDIADLEKYVNKGILKRNILDLYSRICKDFTEVSLNGEKFDIKIWTLKGLECHPFWNNQRLLAKQLLDELNEIDNTDKIICFNNKRDNCKDRIYFDFIDYAFEETDYFMLIYADNNGKGYSKNVEYFKNTLQPYKVKSRIDHININGYNSVDNNAVYEFIFYRNAQEVKQILKQAGRLSYWSLPRNPGNLAFFKENRCRFFYVGSKKTGIILHVTEKDICFAESKKLATQEDIFIATDNYMTFKLTGG